MAKTPIVSKKELEDSGFDNLRDYLNDKRGLTRKGSPIAFKRADPITADSEMGRSRGSRSSEQDMSERDGLGKQMSESDLDMSMAQRDPEATAKFLRSGESGKSRGTRSYGDAVRIMAAQEETDPDMMASKKRRESQDKAIRGMKKGGAVKKMASGGSVSSASSRGDGIAQRGKTRGKMC